MSLPSSVRVITVKGRLWDDDGTGAEHEVRAVPSVDHVTTVTDHGPILLATKTATPSDADPYWEIDLVASNNPGVQPQFSWTFSFSKLAGSWTVTVPHEAAVVDGRREVWLTDLTALVTPPTATSSYYTKSEVDAQFEVFDADLGTLEARVAALEGP